MPQEPRVPPNRYRLYIDESGDHAYNLLDDPSHRYLALLGVWFRQHDHYSAFADALDDFKRAIFGHRPDKPVILHRSEIINRKGPFGVLCQPEVLAKFDSGLLDVVTSVPHTIGCVILDKKGIGIQTQKLLHPYHYCLGKLMDLYHAWLESEEGIGDVMAETRGREQDDKLQVEYRLDYEELVQEVEEEDEDSPAVREPVRFTSREIKIRRKADNIAGLQLADLLAHPVKQAILVANGRIDDPGSRFGRRLYEAVRKNVYRTILA